MDGELMTGGAGAAALIPIVLSILALAAGLFVVLRIKFLRQIALSLIGVIPAIVLALLSLVALVFWRSALWLVSKSPILRFLATWFVYAVHYAGEKAEPEIKDADRGKDEDKDKRAEEAQVEAMFARRSAELARSIWPEEVYPFLYQDVPEDIRRPVWEDGRLIGGLPVTWLADRHLTAPLLTHAAMAGLTAAFLLSILPILAFVLGGLGALVAPYWSAFTAEPRTLESWPDGSQITASRLTYLWQATGMTLATVVELAIRLILFSLAWLLFAAGAGLLVAFAVIETVRREKAKPYQLITKDGLVRWPYRAEARAIAHTTYCKQVEMSAGYLKATPLFQIGKTTGAMRLRGDFNAPMRDQTLCLDGDSVFQHTLVMGGTGEGKTTAILKPLLRQFIARKSFGLYVCDAKGVLWNDALAIVKSMKRTKDVVIIGTGEDQLGVDVVSGLTPTQTAGVLRSVMTQLGGASSDSFWPDMAATVMRHALTIGQAYARTEAGKRLATGADGDDPLNPYSLWWAYQALLAPETLSNALEAIKAILEEELELARSGKTGLSPADYAILTSDEVRASRDYLSGAWKDMAERTQSGILASVSQLMDGFSGAPVLRKRFVSGLSEGTIPLTSALEGKIVLSALSNVEDGLPARLVNILLKTCLYREARLREAAFKAEGKRPQDSPCVVMMDEVQEIVTVDPTSGLSDATFWNVARSTGLIGIFATQTVAALEQAMGEAAAKNFLQQARSKIFLRSEDRATIDYACWCAGKFERNRVFEEGQSESIEHRVLVDQWDPLATPDPDEEFPIKNGFMLMLKAALMLVNPASRQMSQPSVRPVYAPDLRFIPQGGGLFGGGDAQSLAIAQTSARQAAHWRAEDLERKYRAEGNQSQDALTPADMIGMGRWHAYALVQRAGAMRQDIIRLEHDYD